MAEWLRLRAFEENGLNIRRICGGSNPVPSKKCIGWADGTEVTTRRYYGWHRLHFSNSIKHTQSAQRKQSDKKPMTHRHLTGTVGKGTGQGDMNTGQYEGVSDGYLRLAELSITKP